MRSALVAKVKREVKDEIIKPRYAPATLGSDQMGTTVRLTNHIHQLHLQAQGGVRPPTRL
eukprot:gene29515-8302_t